MKVALQVGGNFVCAENGGGTYVTVDRGKIGPWETFTMTDRGNGTVSLQAAKGQYLCAEMGGGMRVMADRGAVGPWETFRVHERGNGTIALQAANGQYLTAGRNPLKWLLAEARQIGPNETFQLIDLGAVSSWMETNYDQIKDKTLAQLCLPGSHDSGTYELFLDLAPDAEKIIRTLWNFGGRMDLPSGMDWASGIGHFIKGMAVTQTKTFYEQFQAGIRYIDLRVCVMNGRFYTCHSLRGNLISVLMQDVRRFLDENTREIVVFKVGFKVMDNAQRDAAWREIQETVGQTFYRPASIDELLRQRFSELVDATPSKRAIFLLDSADNIHGIYSSAITTNAGVIENLRTQTREFGGGKLLEAQFIRPISDDGMTRGYIQKEGCRILPILPLLGAVPLVGPILSGFGFVTAGILAVPAYLAYVRNFDPLPTNLLQNARDSRSILRDYIQWLAATPSTKPPQVITCDFLEELPMVDIAIRISTGQPFGELAQDVRDIRPFPPSDERLVVFECTATAIAAAFRLAAFAAIEAANWLDKYLPALKVLGVTQALRGAGYVLGEVGSAIQKLYNLAAGPLNEVLRQVGYAGREIVAFFKTLGGQFVRFFENLGRVLNPRNWVRAVSDPDAPRSAADAFIDSLEDESFRTELLPAMAEVSEGDWEAVVRIARTVGYEFTAEELMRAVPEGFYQGAGDEPELGWDRSTLALSPG